MIKLTPMTQTTFEAFKKASQEGFARRLSHEEDVPIPEGLQRAHEQFSRLVPDGLSTQDQYFFDVLELDSDAIVGNLCEEEA